MHNLALHALEAGQLQVAAGWIHRGFRADPHDAGLRQLRMRLYAAVLRKTVVGWWRRRPRGRMVPAARPGLRGPGSSRAR